MSADYGRSAGLWSSGLDRIYRRFAAAFVAAAPVGLAGMRVLDAGAGTGALSAELRSVGAQPVAVDLSPPMLRQASALAVDLPVVAADAVRLPLAPGRFDALLSAFLINHLPEPHLLLAEAARVVGPGGLIMVTTFGASGDHPAKAAVDAVARRYGWCPPAWFEAQQRWATQTDTPAGLRGQAQRADLPVVDLAVVEVDAGPLTPSQLAAWRLGHAQLAGFVTRLARLDRLRLFRDAEEAVRPFPHSLRRELLVLSSRRPA